MSMVTVTRDVPKSEPHNFLGRNAVKGETFFVFKGSTYGCVDTLYGVALSEHGEHQGPFFEFPLDAVELIT